MLTYRCPNTNRSISPSESTAIIEKIQPSEKPIVSVGQEDLQNGADENACPYRVPNRVNAHYLCPIKKRLVSVRYQSGPVEKLHQNSLHRKLANPVTKRTLVETRKRKLRQSTSSDERGVDSDEEENILKRRRINTLADVLTLKKLEHLPVAKRIIFIHKMDKSKLSGVRKIEKRINKHDTFTWNMKREVLSLPMRTLREQTLEKAESYLYQNSALPNNDSDNDPCRDIAAKFKRQALRRILRKEEKKEGKSESDDDDEYSAAVLQEATAIMHKEVPDLIAAECIINTHRKHKNRLNRTDKNGYAIQSYTTKFVRCRNSEPVNQLRLRALHEAKDFKDYTDLRRAAVKMNVKNKLARVNCEML